MIVLDVCIHVRVSRYFLGRPENIPTGHLRLIWTVKSLSSSKSVHWINRKYGLSVFIQVLHQNNSRNHIYSNLYIVNWFQKVGDHNLTFKNQMHAMTISRIFVENIDSWSKLIDDFTLWIISYDEMVNMAIIWMHTYALPRCNFMNFWHHH